MSIQRGEAFLCGREIGQSAQNIRVDLGCRLYLTALRIERGLGHERRHIFGIRFQFLLHLGLGGHEFLRIFIQRGQREKFFGIGSLGGIRTVRHDFLHRIASLIHFSQAISRPRQIVQDRRIVLALTRGFLQKAVRPGEIATLVGDLSENAGDLGISWREFARFLCVSESFLLVLERPGIELRKLGYGRSQLGI